MLLLPYLVRVVALASGSIPSDPAGLVATPDGMLYVYGKTGSEGGAGQGFRQGRILASLPRPRLGGSERWRSGRAMAMDE